MVLSWEDGMGMVTLPWCIKKKIPNLKFVTYRTEFESTRSNRIDHDDYICSIAPCNVEGRGRHDA